MNTSLYIAFLTAAALLILSPGPTVMLVTATSLRHGRQAGLVAVAGSTVAAALQLAVVVVGLASVVTLAGDWFQWIRWAGVAYLVYLGLSAWLASGKSGPRERREPRTASNLQSFCQGFVVTLTNPKTLLFHGAFLPQFVDASLPELPQLAILAVSFVAIAGIGDSGWALLAARLGSSWRSSRARRLIDRISGSILLAAAAGLAAVRRT